MERSREDFIVQVMNTGFERAAKSFSKIIGVEVKNLSIEALNQDVEKVFPFSINEGAALHVLTTRIIGELAGKSYLIFNEQDREELFKVTKSQLVLTEVLKDALLLEVDNILSASVISELSNALKVEIYGDVPALNKIHGKEFQSLIKKDSEAQEGFEFVFATAMLQFQEHREIKPKFIWKISSKIFKNIPLIAR